MSVCGGVEVYDKRSFCVKYHSQGVQTSFYESTPSASDSQKTLSYKEVSKFMGSLNWASGLIPLGRLHLRPLQLHFHSLGLTNRFSPLQHSDPLVLATLLRQWQDLLFLTSGIPIRPFQGEFSIFRDASTQGLGGHMGILKLRM